MTNVNDDGIRFKSQDLSLLSPTVEDDNRVFMHNGSSSISLVGGGTATASGLYRWSNADSGWRSVPGNVETLDGYDSLEFARLAEAGTITGSWNIDKVGGGAFTIDGNEPFHVGNKPGTTDLAFDPATQTELDAVDTDLQGHKSDTANPHTVGLSQLSDTDLVGSSLVDGTTTVWDAVNSYIPSAVVQGLDAHTSNTANPHSVTAAQAGAVDLTGDIMTGSLVIDGADLTVTGPDDAAGTITFQPGSDTTTAGTPSITLDVQGNIQFNDLTGPNGFNYSEATDVYDDGTSNAPYSRLSVDSFHTNGLGVGQMYIEGRAIDANSQIYIGTGKAGGQPAQTVELNNLKFPAGSATQTKPVVVSATAPSDTNAIWIDTS